MYEIISYFFYPLPFSVYSHFLSKVTQYSPTPNYQSPFHYPLPYIVKPKFTHVPSQWVTPYMWARLMRFSSPCGMHHHEDGRVVSLSLSLYLTGATK